MYFATKGDKPETIAPQFSIACKNELGRCADFRAANEFLSNPDLKPIFPWWMLEEGGGHGSVYGIVTYQAADSLPGLPVTTYGPFTSPLNVSEAIDKLQFIGGMSESKACLTEALTAALSCFEELGRTEVVRHILLVCCSNPYTAAAGGIITPGAPATVEQAHDYWDPRHLVLLCGYSLKELPPSPAASGT
ncbi:Mediator of RNA polymerase II transcription subunit 25 [Eumeta japonica]|uniref:Mediator of RNA polymerase II transcription subunit 25 n=1 Tax=Eumeta variegata TaxID=151549 RepID=A0A4C1V6K5_EUMVA|nr:Mediator of RNA polymerase II transcription subunit 25 [Eumeta japonica]